MASLYHSKKEADLKVLRKNGGVAFVSGNTNSALACGAEARHKAG
jgi:hypothetical protein